MHHEIIFFLFFQVLFLISWSTIFYHYYHMGQIDFDIDIRRTLSTYKSKLVRLRTVSLSAQG